MDRWIDGWIWYSDALDASRHLQLCPSPNDISVSQVQLTPIKLMPKYWTKLHASPRKARNDVAEIMEGWCRPLPLSKARSTVASLTNKQLEFENEWKIGRWRLWLWKLLFSLARAGFPRKLEDAFPSRIYIYIYIHMCIHIYIYIYIRVGLERIWMIRWPPFGGEKGHVEAPSGEPQRRDPRVLRSGGLTRYTGKVLAGEICSPKTLQSITAGIHGNGLKPPPKTSLRLRLKLPSRLVKIYVIYKWTYKFICSVVSYLSSV